MADVAAAAAEGEDPSAAEETHCRRNEEASARGEITEGDACSARRQQRSFQNSRAPHYTVYDTLQALYRARLVRRQRPSRVALHVQRSPSPPLATTRAACWQMHWTRKGEGVTVLCSLLHSRMISVLALACLMLVAFSSLRAALDAVCVEM